MRKRAICVLIGSLAVLVSRRARADYSESVNGNFSSTNTAPTVISVSQGNNVVTGSVGATSSDGQIDDYFSFTVPAGLALSSIVLTNDVSSSGSTDQTFFGVASGTSISNSNSTAAGMLGW